MTDRQAKTFSTAAPVLVWERLVMNNANVVSYLLAGYHISFTMAQRDSVLVAMHCEGWDLADVLVSVPKAMCDKTYVTVFAP